MRLRGGNDGQQETGGRRDRVVTTRADAGVPERHQSRFLRILIVAREIYSHTVTGLEATRI